MALNLDSETQRILQVGCGWKEPAPLKRPISKKAARLLREDFRGIVATFDYLGTSTSGPYASNRPNRRIVRIVPQSK